MERSVKTKQQLNMELFAIGTFWFWALAIVAFVIITTFVEKEDSSGWWAFGCSLIFFALIYFLGAREPINGAVRYAIHNPISVLLLGVLYLTCGAIWSIVKWYLFLKNKRREAIDEHVRYGKKEKWEPTNIPKANDYRSTILMWMSWWPFSAVWTIANDPIRRAFRHIFDHLEKTYDKIAEHAMKP